MRLSFEEVPLYSFRHWGVLQFVKRGLYVNPTLSHMAATWLFRVGVVSRIARVRFNAKVQYILLYKLKQVVRINIVLTP